MKRVLIAAFATLLPLGAFAQDDPPDINFQFKVDQAIKKGIAYVKGKRIGGKRKGNVLVFLTLLHGGVPENDPDFQALLKESLETDLEATYQVALTAMCLEEYNRVKYQWRIHQCAQFLVDNVSPTGTSRYGAPTIYVEEIKPVPTGTRKAVASGPARKGGSSSKKPGGAPVDYDARQKPKPTHRILVKQKRPGPAEHDHSNMQYAALGFRACYDSGIDFEPELLKLAEKWWREAQEKNPNARKEPLQLDMKQVARKKRTKGPGSTRATTAVMAAPEGWRYTKGSAEKERGSMTAGAIGALCIYDYILGKDWRTDEDVHQGLQWLNKNFTVTENPGLGEKHHYYYLYGLERAGMLFGTELIGDHKWYRTGAEFLLKEQKQDGSWGNAKDTCFAILFLKRATQSLPVATGTRRR